MFFDHISSYGMGLPGRGNWAKHISQTRTSSSIYIYDGKFHSTVSVKRGGCWAPQVVLLRLHGSMRIASRRSSCAKCCHEFLPSFVNIEDCKLYYLHHYTMNIRRAKYSIYEVQSVCIIIFFGSPNCEMNFNASAQVAIWITATTAHSIERLWMTDANKVVIISQQCLSVRSIVYAFLKNYRIFYLSEIPYFK